MIREPDGLWKLQYERGILEEPLKQKFTGFHMIMTFTKEYFRKRNLQLEEIFNASE